MNNQESFTSDPVSVRLPDGMFSTFNYRNVFEVIERTEDGQTSTWRSYDLDTGIYLTQQAGEDGVPIISIAPATDAPEGFESSKKRMVIRHQSAAVSIQVDRVENQDSDQGVFLNGTSIGITDILATDPVEIKFIQAPLTGDFTDINGTPFTIEGVILKHFTTPAGESVEETIWEFTILFQHT